MPDQVQRMRIRVSGGILFLFHLFISVVAAQVDEARIDVVASEAKLHDGWLVPQRGWFGRMDWLPADTHESTYSASFPVVDFAESTAVFRFQVDRPAQIEFELRGPYRPDSNGKLKKVEIEWTKLEIDGGAVSDPPALPSKSWHDEPISIRVDVSATGTVRIKATARLPQVNKYPPRAIPPHDSAFELAKQFQRGVNLGNFLEVPPGENWGDNRCTEADYQAIAAEGFDHVRIPIGWHHHCGAKPEFAIGETTFQQVEQQLDWAEKYKLGAIINVHHFEQFVAQPKDQTEKLRKIWQQLAKRFRDRPLSLAFEILNEPSGAATTSEMNRVYAEVLSAVRLHDSSRAVLIGPGEFNSVDELPKLDLPPDDRLIVTVHLYEPFNFTHQGAPWAGRTGLVRGVQFPGPPIKPLGVPEFADAEIARWLNAYNKLPARDNPSGAIEIESKLDWAQAWGERNSRPIYLGEFGAYTVADIRSRANYYSAVRRAAEARGIGWAIWDWKASFAYWDRRQGQPAEGFHDAIFAK